MRSVGQAVLRVPSPIAPAGVSSTRRGEGSGGGDCRTCTGRAPPPLPLPHEGEGNPRSALSSASAKSNRAAHRPLCRARRPGRRWRHRAGGGARRSRRGWASSSAGVWRQLSGTRMVAALPQANSTSKKVGAVVAEDGDALAGGDAEPLQRRGAALGAIVEGGEGQPPACVDLLEGDRLRRQLGALGGEIEHGAHLERSNLPSRCPGDDGNAVNLDRGASPSATRS